MVGSHDDANDLLQEIFIKIWSALPSFRGDAQLFTWVYRIATNETLNYLRKQRVRSILSFQKITNAEERIADDPYFNGGEAEKLLVKALDKLPPKQKAVFSMRYYDDMKYEDIAQIMNTSVGSLKASYHIAYQKIKDELKKNSTDF
jgi:RNA polymerase sigma-70 factor (ECF subfamily)